MIHFWTDRRPGEPDILAPLKDATLMVTTIEGDSLYMSTAPAEGWTHERLEEKARALSILTSDGANAWLGAELVGSTEV